MTGFPDLYGRDGSFWPATTHHLPVPAEPVLDLDKMVDAYERSIIEHVLRSVHGRRIEAARILGISRRTLFYKLRKHGMHST